jgi:hypothetical protein
MNDELRRLASHAAIQQVLARYCRGIDRLDRALLASAYWPDGFDDHVGFAGKIPEFLDWVSEAVRQDISTCHFIGQSLIVLDGHRALAETYFQSHRQLRRPTHDVLAISLGRYVDQFEERAGEWRILDRKVILDIRNEIPLPADQAPPPAIVSSWKGQHGPGDPSYRSAELKALTGLG